MTKIQRVFVWAGGAMFVTSLAICAYRYLIIWARPGLPAAAPFTALGIDILLLSIFAMHHSVFARERVKTRLARAIPGPLLRAVYVWTASVLLILVCRLWRPIGGSVFDVTGVRVFLHAAVQLAGVGLIARAAAGIDPLELAGIRLSSGSALQTGGAYRWIRHPLYLGWVMVTFGAAHMTGDRLAFAVITTIYLFIAVPWEERSLVESFGEDYVRYQRQVRWRIVPFVY